MSSPWQSQFTDLKSRWQHMFETKVLSDCTFVVGKGNGQLVKGHKAVVSAASPVLQEKLTAAKGDHPKIVLTDVEPEIFQLILKYIYTDAIEVNADTACDLATAAETYQLTYLLKACYDFIAVNLTPKNVLQVYRHALHSSDSGDLKKKCEEVMKTKTKEVLTDSSFEEACLDVVVAMYSLESLEIDSELDLINAADRYAKRVPQCQDADNNFLTIRNVLEKIRFLTLTTEEFGKCRTNTTVLSDSDACALLYNIVYKNSMVPMPTGFSQSKDARKKQLKIILSVPDIESFLNKTEAAWSSIFELQNIKWKVKAVKETKDSVKSLGVYVYCNWESESETWSCNADVEMNLLRSNKDKPNSRNFTRLFRKSSFAWGFDSFIEASQLLDPNNHYIKDGNITIETIINAEKPRGL